MLEKLNILDTYCQRTFLDMNVEKTKIITFCRGRKKKKKENVFTYRNEIIEVVSEVTYLGVKFSKIGVCLRIAEEAVSMASIASSTVGEICVRTTSRNWQ